MYMYVHVLLIMFLSDLLLQELQLGQGSISSLDITLTSQVR